MASSIRIIVSVDEQKSFENYNKLICRVTDNFCAEKFSEDYKVFLVRTPYNFGGFKILVCLSSICGKKAL